MNWIKHGCIFINKGDFAWNKSHAQGPVVDMLTDERWRIYYATRNSKGMSQISFFETEAGKPENITYEHPSYLFDFGDPGSFDDNGLMPTSIVTHEGRKYLYYIGWTLKQKVPYHNSIGLAVSNDNGLTFKRLFKGPVVGITHKEPYFTGTAYVIIDDGLWRMWYLSCTKWELINDRFEPYYHIKYAESNDGIIWNRHGHVAIDYKDEDEGGIVSASVLKESGAFKMWYAYRKAIDYRTSRDAAYRIGYAESVDGISWNRLDEQVGIELSDEGWDSEMMSYPCVIRHKGSKFMFYNGNGFGQTGIGYSTQILRS